MDHNDDQYIILEKQLGFRSKRLCKDQVAMITDYTVRNLDNKHLVDMAILNFYKAFDNVSHHHLSQILSYYSIEGDKPIPTRSSRHH